MKALIFDAGPIISLTTNSLLWILEPLKQKFGGEFYMAEGVRNELVERPLQTKKFKFEALQVEHLIETNVIRIIKSKQIFEKAKHLLNLANDVFHVRNHAMNVMQMGELETLAAAKIMGIPYVAVDERITRLLLENPGEMEQLLERKMHADVKVDTGKLTQLHHETEGIKLIRSTELVTMAYELGILDKFVTEIPDARKQLLQAVLWGMKLNGCSIGQEDIDEIVHLELER